MTEPAPQFTVHEVTLPITRSHKGPMVLRQEWISGSDPETGTEFELLGGLGLGNPLLHLVVRVPGHPDVHETMDVSQLVTQRVGVIIAEAKK